MNERIQIQQIESMPRIKKINEKKKEKKKQTISSE